MRKYENFCNALSNMKDIYNYEEPYDNVVITGLVGLDMQREQQVHRKSF